MGDVAFRRSSRCSAGGCLEVGVLPDGVVVLRTTAAGSLRLMLGPREWADFVAGVKNGDFD